MALQKSLEHIFNNDYPGTQVFIKDVITPVFGNDIEIINGNVLDTPELKAKATKIGIKSINRIADITDENLLSYDISLFDVVLNNSCNIEQAKVNIQEIVRKVMLTYSHVFILFHYENPKDVPWRLSYAYKEGTLTSMTSAKRYTYVFGKNYKGRTAAERFEELSKTQKTDEDLIEAFSVQALSDDFFNSYRAYYAVFVEYITGEDYAEKSKDDNLKKIIKEFKWIIDNPGHVQFAETFNSEGKIARDYIKKMFGRIIFLYFLQRKGWLYDNDGKADYRYMHNLFLNAGTLQENFLDAVLETLFFYVLNTDGTEKRKEEAAIDGKDIKVVPGWQEIPYLNGGLFSKDEIDEKTCKLPAIYFEKFFEFLDSFNFTIDENDEEDAEIGIDPEMLGRIFESLLEDNKDKGAYYTPKPIVDFMCRESIIAYLQEEIKTVDPEQIRNLVENLDKESLTKEQREKIKDKLKVVTICDPAIGSGAFPMGLLNLLFKLRVILNDDLSKEKIKRDILENNIYGVDIEQGAVDIARLRFWLSMIVDEPKPIPLPNLHFKIMHGNSLLERIDGEDLSKLTQYDNNSPDGTIDFSDNGDRKRLSEALKKYYNIQESKRKKELLQEIISNVKCQIEDKGISLNDSFDPSSNSDFFLWHTWFNDVFQKKGGFDIVIGNPPYIRRTSLPAKDKKQYENLFVSAKEQYDIYLLFIEWGIKILKQRGFLTFINPLRFFNADYGIAARNYIMENTSIKEIIDISQLKVFQNAMTYPCIFILEKSVVNDKFFFIRPKNLNEISNNEMNKHIFSQKQIREDDLKRILVGEEKLKNIIKRIEGTGKTFNDYFTAPRGLANNKINFNNGNLKAIKSKQVKKYKIEGDFVLVNTKESQQFHEKSIIMPRTVKSLQASIKPEDIICLDRIYWLQSIKQIKTLLPFLGILNSKLINFWFEYNYWSTKVKGNYFDLNGDQILSIPVIEDLIEDSTFIKIVEENISNVDQNAENKLNNYIFKKLEFDKSEINLMKEFMAFNGHSF